MYPEIVWVLHTSSNRYLVDVKKINSIVSALNDSKNAGIRLENYQKRIPRFDVIDIEAKEVTEWIRDEIDRLKNRKKLTYEGEWKRYIGLDAYLKTPALD